MALDLSMFAKAVWLAVALVALGAVYRFVFLPAMVAGFRQNLFALRRELFLLMADGVIEPTHPVYVRLRMTMNGLLRFAERVSLVRVAVTFLTMKDYLPAVPHLSEMIAKVENKSQRQSLEHVYNRLGLILVKHVLATSALACVLFFVLVLFSIGLSLLRGLSLKSMGERLGKKVEPVAEALSADADCDLPAAA